MTFNGIRAVWIPGALLCALACGTSEIPTEIPVSSEARNRGVPRVERIDFSPSRPQPGDRVVAHVTLRPSPIEGTTIDLDFTWRLNGVRQPERGPSFEIPGDAPGRQIEVMVIARDGGRESQPLRKRISAANRKPQVRAVALEVEDRLDTTASIGATVRADDPDGDPLVYEYRWTVNGRRVDVKGPRFPGSGYRRGDEIQVEVVASDGAGVSRPRRSARVTLGNSPPRIFSAPGSIGEDGVFLYRIAIDDPDGDMFFRYRLIEAPAGMRIDLADGEISWSPLPEQAGTHRVVLEVDDRHGGLARQEFDLGVGVEEVPIAGR